MVRLLYPAVREVIEEYSEWNDRIFPPAHMAAYWKELAIPVPDMPHYPFGDRTAMEKLLKSNEP